MIQTVALPTEQIADIARMVATQLTATTPLHTITFGELFHLYFEKHVKVRLRNAKNAYYFWTAHGSRWTDVSVHQITRRDLQEWADGLATKSPSTATRAVNMMNAIINWGIRREFLPPISNPCVGVEKFTVDSRKRFISPNEFGRLKAALEAESSLIRDLFMMCLLTGQRRGNVLSMRWDEIDFYLASWTIPAAKFKTDDEHVLPLVPWAVEILERRRQVGPESPWVFPGPRGKVMNGVRIPPDHIREPKRAWERVLKRAGIDDLRVHDLRRSLASYMAIAGENQYVIGQMLGHKDPRSTAVYARLNLKAVRLAADKVSEAFRNMAAVPVALISTGADERIARQPVANPKNANARVTPQNQVIVEGKILSAIRAGNATRKSFYRKIGSSVCVNSSELTRILAEMEERRLISRDTESSYARYSCGMVSSQPIAVPAEAFEPYKRPKTPVVVLVASDEFMAYVERRILALVAAAPRTKSQLHGAFCGVRRVTAPVLQQILNEMVASGRLACRQEEGKTVRLYASV